MYIYRTYLLYTYNITGVFIYKQYIESIPATLNIKYELPENIGLQIKAINAIDNVKYFTNPIQIEITRTLKKYGFIMHQIINETGE